MEADDEQIEILLYVNRLLNAEDVPHQLTPQPVILPGSDQWSQNSQSGGHAVIAHVAAKPVSWWKKSAERAGSQTIGVVKQKQPNQETLT